MKKNTPLLLVIIVLSYPAMSQSDSVKFSEKLMLDFPLADLPYMNHAADMAYNKRLGRSSTGNENPVFMDYLRSYESPSMAQSLAVTKNFNATNYYFQNKLWNRWLTPDTKKRRFLNRVAANGTAGIVDYILAYQLMVFSPVWNHEEFHRNGLTLQGISSFDDTYYKFGGDGYAGGSVSQVKDEDMIRFKAEAPEAMVRSFAAGIESQFQLVRSMQKDDFFNKTAYANVIFHILITKQAVDYVNQFRKSDYDVSIDTMNYYGETIPERDFVGWDFSPWVYDLFRPDEPYQARGVHPSGIGIDRAIKRAALTAEEDAYLTRMGKLQYLNFISPFMIGIKEIKLSTTLSFNFALRHYPTSFGYNINADIFLNHNGKQWLIGLHSFSNQKHTYPGLEVYQPNYTLKIAGTEIPVQARAMIWIQPEDESFYATNGQAGGLLGARLSYPVNDYLNFYFEAEGKTNGWVAGNPFLKPNLSTRIGISCDFTKR